MFYEGPDTISGFGDLFSCNLCSMEAYPVWDSGSQPLVPHPRRHLPMSTGIFVCHFKDDCCLCLVDRGQRSFAVSCDAHCSPQSKTMLHSKNGSHVSGQTELDSTVSTKHSQRQAAAVVRLKVWWSRPVLALVVCCFAGFVFWIIFYPKFSVFYGLKSSFLKIQTISSMCVTMAQYFSSMSFCLLSFGWNYI